MSLVETLHRQHVARQARFAAAAARPKAKAKPQTYEIPNAPLGVPKIDPNRPPPVTEEWVERQKRIHAFKQPWFEIVDGPRQFMRKGKPPVRIDEIQHAVSEHYGIKRPDMLSIRRLKGLVWPRQVAMYLCKRLTMKSLPEIGKAFGGRDHTTVLHAVRKIDRQLLTEQRLQASVEMLVEKLGGDLD